MIFYKTVSAGNDFIHVDRSEPGAVRRLTDRRAKSRLARELCQRHTGAGADGVVYYKLNRHPNQSPAAPSADFEIFNRDGGEAEISGNGMAGLTALLFHLDKFPGVKDAEVALNTRAGVKRNRFLEREGNKFRLKIEIGEPDFGDRKLFPFLETGKTAYRYQDIDFYPVSVGNPHAVVVLPSPAGAERLEQIGRTLESAGIFPFKTNVEIAAPRKTGITADENGKHLDIFFYERGVGPTLASSTGSAAAFAVLSKLGLIRHCLDIHREDLEDEIKISGNPLVYIENSTEIVYKGVYLKR
jgi:diaminopimelate epimerase